MRVRTMATVIALIAGCSDPGGTLKVDVEHTPAEPRGAERILDDMKDFTWKEPMALRGTA